MENLERLRVFFLFFYFGRRRLIAPNFVSGHYVLEVSMANWTIQNGKKEIAHSESPDKRIVASVRHFQGKKLLEIVVRKHFRIKQDYYSARLSFEDRWYLNIYMYDKGKHDEMFSVHDPSSITSYNYSGELKTKKIANIERVGTSP